MNAIRHRLKSILLIFAIVGPGIIAAAVGNDAGGITTYSVAGAHFGYNILWVMVPATFILIIVQEMCARMGVMSGKGLSDLIRESYGAKVTFYILIGLLIANLGTIISEFSGIASSLEIFNIPRYVSVPILGVAIWWFIIKGNYKSVEKVFIMAAVIYLAYIVSGLLAKPDWNAVLKGTLTPSFQFSSSYVMIIVGIIGTTIAPWMQFYLQSSMVEKGLKMEGYRYTKLDIAVGSIGAGLVAFFIIMASAATLYVHGINIETASDAAIALAPFAGRFAELLFAIGLLNASLLGAMIVPISTSYYICEGLGFESGINKSFKEAPWFNGIFTVLLILGGIPAMFPQTPLVKMMLLSQVVNGILLAPILIFILLLVNKKWLMGKHVNSRFYNTVSWITISILICLSVVLVATTIYQAL